MISKDILKGGRALLAVAALPLGMSACGGNVAPKPEKTKQAPAKIVSGIGIKAIYFSNGTRELQLSGWLNNDSNNNGSFPENIFEFCDGHDLVEELLQDSGNSNSLDRSVNYPGCSDGKLTPADFRLDPSAEK